MCVTGAPGHILPRLLQTFYDSCWRYYPLFIFSLRKIFKSCGRGMWCKFKLRFPKSSSEQREDAFLPLLLPLPHLVWQHLDANMFIKPFSQTYYKCVFCANIYSCIGYFMCVFYRRMHNSGLFGWWKLCASTCHNSRYVTQNTYHLMHDHKLTDLMSFSAGYYSTDQMIACKFGVFHIPALQTHHLTNTYMS